jgi:hypothetical protein
MALSGSVEASLKEAESALRNSLSFAARQEKPYVSVMISKMISDIDNLIQIDKFSDKLEEKMKNSDNGMFGGFF